MFSSYSYLGSCHLHYSGLNRSVLLSGHTANNDVVLFDDLNLSGYLGEFAVYHIYAISGHIIACNIQLYVIVFLCPLTCVTTVNAQISLQIDFMVGRYWSVSLLITVHQT